MWRLRDRVQPKIFAVPVHDSPTNPKSAVPIPARFLNTESSTLSMALPMDETSAAIKIQSAFRGFSTRKCAPLKNLKIIHDVKAKAEDVRRRIADRQVVESIRQNEKERLKISEEIMSLILKLDAIQEVHSFVREARRAVVRELVSLEKDVDAIIAGKSTEGTGMEYAVDSETGEDDPVQCFLRFRMRRIVMRSYKVD